MKTVKIDCEFNFSESDKDETKERLQKLNDIMNQVKKENPDARFFVLDVGDLKTKKKANKNIDKVIKIEDINEIDKIEH
jgi:hypothetical protein